MKKAIILFIVGVVNLSFLHASYVEDTYTVRDVKVAASGKSAVEAEKIAMKKAKEKAFRMLMTQLVSEDQAEELSRVSADQIERFVDSLEVNNQQISKISFQATLTVNFDANQIQQYLGGRVKLLPSTEPSPQQKEPLVVIPLYIDQGSILLWGDDNPWLQAWAREDTGQLSTPIQVPFGDLQDISMVDPQQIMRGEISSLRALAQRYGATSVVIAILKKDHSDTGAPMSVEAKIMKADGSLMPLFHSEVLTSAGDEKQQIHQAITIVQKQLSDKLPQLLKAGEMNTENRITALVQFHDQKDWFSTRNIIQSLNIVKGMDLNSLSRQGAKITLTYKGSMEMLAAALSDKGYQLEQLDGGVWLLRRIQKTTFDPYSS